MDSMDTNCLFLPFIFQTLMMHYMKDTQADRKSEKAIEKIKTTTRTKLQKNCKIAKKNFQKKGEKPMLLRFFSTARAALLVQRIFQ